MKIKINGHKCRASVGTNDLRPSRRRKRKRKRSTPRQARPGAVADRQRERLAADIDRFLKKPKIEVIGIR